MSEIIDENDNVKPVISVMRTPIFSKTYGTNVGVSKTDSDFRIELYNEKFETDDHRWIYHCDGLVILTAQAAKKLLLTLTEKIEQYEDENGEIIIPEERMRCK
jgi:Protein of unknown function (DUF3467).